MFPVFFKLGPVQFYTTTLFMVISFFAGMYVFWRKGREEHYVEDELIDIYFIALLLGVIASRVAFVAFHFDQFGMKPLEWLNVFGQPGFMPIFGLIAAGFSLFSSAQRKKWDAYEVLDFATLSASLSTFLMWVGNFFAGAELGTPTQMPWGIVFPHVFDKRHPLQIYGAVIYLLIFLYLFRVEGKYRMFSWYRARKDSAQSGFLFAMFCILTGIAGSMLWIWSENKTDLFGISVDLPIRVIMIIYGLVTLFRRSGRSFSFKKARAS